MLQHGCARRAPSSRLCESTACSVAFLLGLFVAGCAGEYPQSTIDPRSDFASVIHSLYVSVFWWTMLILVVVWGVLAYILVRFRAREGDTQPRQLRGHLGLEIGWTVAPAIIVVAIAIPTIRAVFATQRPASDDALIVEVTGHRFWWEFSYPELGVRTANELHLPLGRPVSLRLSARDVVHSFWVPALGGKRDVAPFVAVREGEDPRYTWLHLTPSVPGVYMGQCAEYCGEAHALMGIRVLVETEDDFGAWTSGWLAGDAGPAPPLEEAEAQQPVDQPPETTPQPPETTVQGDPAQLPGAAGQAGTGQPSELDTESALAAAGRDVFLTQSTCAACHAIGGTPAQGRVGPDLTLFGNRTTLGAGLLENTPENIARWIRDPQGLKPGAEMPGADYALEGGTGQAPTWPATGLDEEQVAAVAAYLHSLR